MYKLIPILSEKNKISPSWVSPVVECHLRRDITPVELYHLLLGLSRYDRISIDLEPFRDLGLTNVAGETLELILFTIHLHLGRPPVSFKSSDDQERGWEISGTPSPAVRALMEAQSFAKSAQETPPNLMNPDAFIGATRKLFGDIPGVQIEVLGPSELASEGMNLIMAVGRASSSEPRLMILRYNPGDLGTPPRALIGKGVCFDTGGLNVKTMSHMSNMKFDMSGAASAVATLYALARSGSGANLVVAIPLVENSISSNAYRPDDVIISHSGKSVEIENTDAEGRLILADAISYVSSRYSPSEIITIATLTGAIGYALGYKYAGAWSTSEDGWGRLEVSARNAGEAIWRMPLDDYYLKALRSRIADLRNSAKVGAGGASRAACFLREFAGGIDFTHLDIANVAHGENDSAGNAPMVRTLYGYLLG